MSCPFCKGNNLIKTAEFRSVGDISAKIEGTVISLHIMNGDGGGGRYPNSFKEDYIPIIYCPMCGSRLDV